MGKITWTERFSVGNNELDAQHQELIRLYNQLHKCLLEESSNALAATKLETLASLRHYTTRHFSTEETYMQEIGYPDLAKHQTLHRQFAEKVNELHDTLADGQIILSTSLIKFIRNWILEHLANEDAQYRDYAGSR